MTAHTLRRAKKVRGGPPGPVVREKKRGSKVHTEIIDEICIYNMIYMHIYKT